MTDVTKLLEALEEVGKFTHVEPSEENENYLLEYTGKKKLLPKMRTVAKKFGVEITKPVEIGEVSMGKKGKRKAKLYRSELVVLENQEETFYVEDGVEVKLSKKELAEIEAEVESEFEGAVQPVPEPTEDDIMKQEEYEALQKEIEEKGEVDGISTDYKNPTIDLDGIYVISSYVQVKKKTGEMQIFKRLKCSECDYLSKWRKPEFLEKTIANHKCKKVESEEESEEI